jgi:hypothetical protein
MTGNDPNMGSRFIQSTSIRQLEQLALNDWYYVQYFLLDYYALAAKAQALYDPLIKDKIFMKLPGALGEEIHKASIKDFIKEKESSEVDGVPYRCWFIMQYLQRKCTEIQIQKTVKTGHKWCRNIYITPQQYGTIESYHTRRKQQKAKKKSSRPHIPKRKTYS